MISLINYAKVRNKYCICYNGHKKHYIIELLEAIPLIKSKYADLNIFIACKDEFAEELGLIPISTMKNLRNDFGYIREMRGDQSLAKIILKECNIE